MENNKNNNNSVIELKNEENKQISPNSNINIKNYIAVKKEKNEKENEKKLSKVNSCMDIKSNFEISKSFYPIAEMNSNESHI